MEHWKNIKSSLSNSFKKIITGVLLSTPVFSWSQENLIINPSFEQLTYIPDNHHQYDATSNWDNLNNNSIDLYYRGITQPFETFFDNPAGSQDTPWGDVYVGIGNTIKLFSLDPPYNGPFFALPPDYTTTHYDYLEILGANFSKTLIKNRIYRFSFYVSVGDNTYSQKIDASSLATNCLDVYALNSDEFDIRNPKDYGHQVYKNEPILTDTMNWVEISGCFKALGDEKKLAIGCIRDTNDIAYIEQIDWGNDIGVVSYLYLDNFSMYECDTCCLGQFTYQDHVNVSNNPSGSGSSTVLTVVLNSNTSAVLSIYDSAGRIVARNEFYEMVSNYTLEERFESGMYHWVLESSNGILESGKLLVGKW